MRTLGERGGVGEKEQEEGWVSLSELSSELGLPSWKVSRLVKRLLALGWVEVREERRGKRGRPAKSCRFSGPSPPEFSLVSEWEGGLALLLFLLAFPHLRDRREE
ncbi:MAG: hypothetical protein DSO03_03915 [Hadesarchaea archaeon]|nr:MAG: hypothetical protein DSO03_03915 [Hadesarchaea archaeon]